MNKVSIIIPIYNLEKYIIRCIISCISQTYRNIEIIAVDDGSLDNTSLILANIAKTENRLKILTKENGGVSSAREAGITLATGDYLFFLDGDDYLTTDAIELMVKRALESHADIIDGNYAFVDQEGRVKEKVGLKFDILNPEAYLTLILKHQQIYLCFKLIRRSLYMDIMIPEEITLGEDAICYVQLVGNARTIAKCDALIYYYFRRNDSVTMSPAPNDLIMSYKSSEWIFDFMSKKYSAAEVQFELKKFKTLNLILYLKRMKITGQFRSDIKATVKYILQNTSRKRLGLSWPEYSAIEISRINPFLASWYINRVEKAKSFIYKNFVHRFR